MQKTILHEMFKAFNVPKITLVFVAVVATTGLGVALTAGLLPASPSITVASPNGGQTWQTGTTQTITWNATGLTDVGLHAMAWPSGVIYVIGVVPASPNSYSWQVGRYIDNVAHAYRTLPAGNYKIYINGGPANWQLNDASDNFLTITPAIPPSVTVISPNGGQTWQTGTPQPITWTSTGLANVGLHAMAWPSGTIYVLDVVPASPNSYSWQVGKYKDSVTNTYKTLPAGNYKIYINGGSENWRLYDVSNNTITVTPAPQPTVTVISPNGGQTWQTGTPQPITWTSTGLDNVGIHVQTFPSGTVYLIGVVPASPATYSWNVGTTQNGTVVPLGSYYKIYLNGGPGHTNVFDTSDSYFGITAPTCKDFTYSAWSACVSGRQTKTIISSLPAGCAGGTPDVLTKTCTSAYSIKVTSPNGGQSWPENSVQSISWESIGLDSIGVHVQVFPSGMIYLLDIVPASQGVFAWVVGPTQNGILPPGSYYKIYLNGGPGHTDIFDTSDNYFSIAPPPSITVTSPNGGEVWNFGELHDITWRAVSVDVSDTVRIILSDEGGGCPNGFVIATVPAIQESYSWQTGASPDYLEMGCGLFGNTAWPSSKLKISISLPDNTLSNNKLDYSDGSFTIPGYSISMLPDYTQHGAVQGPFNLVPALNSSERRRFAIVAAGSSPIFTMVPEDGYKVKDVLVDGASVGAVASYAFSNIGANHTISASFTSSPPTPPPPPECYTPVTNPEPAKPMWEGISGDWDGNGKATIGTYDIDTSTFYLKNTNSAGAADLTFTFDSPSSDWKPIAGDWNGDGKDTIGLYDSSTSTFYLRNSNVSGNADLSFIFGSAGTYLQPIAGDWDGDGKDTIGLYDSSTSTFYLRNLNSAGTSDIQFVYGLPDKGRRPVAGDWNNDGKTTVGVYDPFGGVFYLRNTNDFGAVDLAFAFGPEGIYYSPISGDWDKQNGESVGLYSPIEAEFYLYNDSATAVDSARFKFGQGVEKITPEQYDVVVPCETSATAGAKLNSQVKSSVTAVAAASASSGYKYQVDVVWASCDNSKCDHRACVGNACTTVLGAGKNTCTTSANCGTSPTHLACVQALCAPVPGAGTDACDTGFNCTSSYNVCNWVTKTCDSVSGLGTNECFAGNDCGWPYCGNGVCDAGETCLVNVYIGCADCGPCPWCGDGICNGGETSTCPDCSVTLNNGLKLNNWLASIWSSKIIFFNSSLASMQNLFNKPLNKINEIVSPSATAAGVCTKPTSGLRKGNYQATMKPLEYVPSYPERMVYFPSPAIQKTYDAYQIMRSICSKLPDAKGNNLGFYLDGALWGDGAGNLGTWMSPHHVVFAKNECGKCSITAGDALNCDGSGTSEVVGAYVTGPQGNVGCTVVDEAPYASSIHYWQLSDAQLEAVSKFYGSEFANKVRKVLNNTIAHEQRHNSLATAELSKVNLTEWLKEDLVDLGSIEGQNCQSILSGKVNSLANNGITTLMNNLYNLREILDSNTSTDPYGYPVVQPQRDEVCEGFNN